MGAGVRETDVRGGGANVRTLTECYISYIRYGTYRGEHNYKTARMHAT